MRSTTRQWNSRSRLRSWEDDSSWSKMSTPASAILAAAAISSTLPRPIRVAGSGRSRRCNTSPTTTAPALVVSSRSSASDSSALNGTAWSSASRRRVFEADLACCAWGGMRAVLRAESSSRIGSALGDRACGRLRNSTPTRKARSGSPGDGGAAQLRLPRLPGSPGTRRSAMAHPCDVEATGAAGATGVAAGEVTWAGRSRCGARAMTTVEIACLKINCS